MDRKAILVVVLALLAWGMGHSAGSAFSMGLHPRVLAFGDHHPYTYVTWNDGKCIRVKGDRELTESERAELRAALRQGGRQLRDALHEIRDEIRTNIRENVRNNIRENLRVTRKELKDSTREVAVEIGDDF